MLPDHCSTQSASHRSSTPVAVGCTFVQNLWRRHYELATKATTRDRVAVAFAERAHAV